MGTLEEIQELEARLLDGDRRSDADTSAVFDELLADDVVFVQPGGVSVGKAGVLAGHRPPRKRTFVRVDVTETRVDDLGGVVAVTARTEFHLPDRSFALRQLRLWSRRNGRWQVVWAALMEAPAPPD